MSIEFMASDISVGDWVAFRRANRTVIGSVEYKASAVTGIDIHTTAGTIRAKDVLEVRAALSTTTEAGE